MATRDVSDTQVCRAYVAYGRGEASSPEEFLMKETAQPMKVCIRAMERAFDRGLIDYGVSLRGAWLTEKGKALLADELGN